VEGREVRKREKKSSTKIRLKSVPRLQRMGGRTEESIDLIDKGEERKKDAANRGCQNPRGKDL
jgi:hypothetical protein